MPRISDFKFSMDVDESSEMVSFLNTFSVLFFPLVDDKTFGESAWLSAAHSLRLTGWPDMTLAGSAAISYKPTPFIGICQVLCVQKLTGQCYWEIERSNEKEVDIGVAYKDIYNMYPSARLGQNDLSWSLSCKSEGCSFYHQGNKTHIIGLIPGNRIGVFLDHKEGTLSFYDVSDMIT